MFNKHSLFTSHFSYALFHTVIVYICFTVKAVVNPTAKLIVIIFFSELFIIVYFIIYNNFSYLNNLPKNPKRPFNFVL